MCYSFSKSNSQISNTNSQRQYRYLNNPVKEIQKAKTNQFLRDLQEWYVSSSWKIALGDLMGLAGVHSGPSLLMSPSSANKSDLWEGYI